MILRIHFNEHKVSVVFTFCDGEVYIIVDIVFSARCLDNVSIGKSPFSI